MPLTPGTKLGQYEVVESIGAGGMGEVYRARDTKLGRDVAIKVLPEEFARDKDRLDRFEREARLLAQLNHANIATLHGLEEHDGQKFIVMELVEGETLAERIERGAIPVDEAIPLFIQIVEGLEAAHEKAIIHRDLKPANIKIGPDGKPKILDFGLAKAFAEEQDGSAESSQSPTLTRGTALGVIMGTASYMSPEQARGKALDKRTDIWAFGCCLYEALTGKKTFDGETVTDVIAAVVNKDPDWDALSASVPRHVRHLLERCLRKSPRERLRDIGDARLELLEKETDTGAAAHGAWSTRPKIVAVVALLLALLVGLVARDVLESPAVSRAMHLSVEITPAERIGDSGETGEATAFLQRQREQWLTRTAITLSPDGQHLVFVGWRDNQQLLFHRPLVSPEARPIRGTEGAVNPFFSPDGEWIGYWSEGELKKVALGGGPSIPLCSVRRPFGASWGSDDTIVFAGFRGELMAVPAKGGDPRTLVEPTEELIRLPWVLPDANAVLFTTRRFEQPWDETEIVVYSISSGESKVLVEGGAQPMFTESGHLLYVKLGVLWAAPFDAARLELLGPAVPVVEGIVQNIQETSVSNRTGAAQISVSASGNLAYLAGGLLEDAGRSLVWVDRDGSVEPLPFELGGFWYPRISPDGLRIAIGEPEGVSILDLRRAIQQRLPGTDTTAHVGAWSPDSARIVFLNAGARALFWQLADGSESPQPLTTGERLHFAGPWHPDGSEILIYDVSDADILALTMPPSEGKPRPVLAEPAASAYPALSPDGRWLAYASDESGRFEVYVRPYPSLEGKQQVSRNGGVMPVWSRSGDELFYVLLRSSQRERETMMAVEMSSGAGTPRELFQGQFVVGVFLATYDVAQDGRFLMGVPSEAPEAAHTSVRLVLNWFEELERLVPTN